MDWLRRNWPDLTIGVALVAVIALIVATLLSGGSLASLVRRDNPPEIPITNTTGNTVENTAGTDTADTGETEGTADTASVTDARDTGDGTTGVGASGDDIDVFVPGIPDGQVTGEAADGGTGSGTNGNQVLPTLPGDAENAGAGVAETAAGPLPEASEAGGFRVAAGALDSRDAASTLAQSYRDDGYEVLVEQQGDLYLLWIGPYATREDADTAAARIVADGGDALVYTYSGEDAGDDAADGGDANPDEAEVQTPEAVTDATPDTANRTTANNTATTPARGGEADQNANTEDDTAAETVAGQRYLQVGAFAADENAQPLRDQLEQLGLDITSSEDAAGLVRLFVGPFGSAQLTQTQTRLDAQGIDSFPVVR